MSGVTKHIYNREIFEYIGIIDKILKIIEPILPEEYDADVLMVIIKKYYPYDILHIEERLGYYKIKNKYLIKQDKKSRYSVPSIFKMLKSTSMYKKVTNARYQENHKENFDSKLVKENEKLLWKKREPKIRAIQEKIERGKYRTQQVEPEFLDVLIGLYERKNTSQNDKLYIMTELKKYYCDKALNFFIKQVDVEYNRQLRDEAFYYLQSIGFRPRMRRQKDMRIPSKSKRRREWLKNVYGKATSKIKAIPEELEYRILNNPEQKIVAYDYFISHSYLDGKAVKGLIESLNEYKKLVYCDWISDYDYLKRKLVCKATLNVIEKRIEKSKAVLFVESSNSVKSKWCRYELNYAYEHNIPVYAIKIEDSDNVDEYINPSEYEVSNYFNENYKNVVMI